MSNSLTLVWNLYSKKVNRYSGRKNVVGGKLTYNPNNWKNYGTPIGADGVLKTPENFIKKLINIGRIKVY